MSVRLGDKVCDEVSGFEGIAVARHSYLQGCDRISIQPKTNKDGKLPETESFDEPQLVIVETNVVVPRTKPVKLTGGPSKYEDKGRP